MPEFANRPLVSILMLTYNRARYIGAAIESALAQSYENFELIILDDGSTDNTAAIVYNYQDPRIRYIQDSINKGLFIRRNESLTYARGAYVAILDSDDVWSDSEKLAKQVAFMEEHRDCAVLGTFITLIDQNGNPIGKNQYHTTDAAIRRTMLMRNQFANSSVLLRKSFLDKTTGYQNLSHAEDMELFLQLGLLGTFANLPEHAVAYRIHPGGESARKVTLGKATLRAIALHQHEYPNALLGKAKMLLFITLATLRII